MLEARRVDELQRQQTDPSLSSWMDGPAFGAAASASSAARLRRSPRQKEIAQTVKYSDSKDTYLSRSRAAEIACSDRLKAYEKEMVARKGYVVERRLKQTAPLAAAAEVLPAMAVIAALDSLEAVREDERQSLNAADAAALRVKVNPGRYTHMSRADAKAFRKEVRPPARPTARSPSHSHVSCVLPCHHPPAVTNNRGFSHACFCNRLASVLKNLGVLTVFPRRSTWQGLGMRILGLQRIR
jgi:hypothetical protein